MHAARHLSTQLGWRRGDGDAHVGALRSHFGPDAKLVGIIRPYVANVLEGTKWLDEHVYYDPRSNNPALRGLPVIRRSQAAI